MYIYNYRAHTILLTQINLDSEMMHQILVCRL